MALAIPPLDVSFLNLPDFHLQHNPKCDYAILTSPYPPVDSGALAESIHITWLEFARAIHRAAHFTQSALSSDRDDATGVICLLANMDAILYRPLVLGIIKTGNIVRTVVMTVRRQKKN